MYDLMIIGAGPGGYEAAIRAAQNGLSVLLFEQEALGGTCLNKGCVPTKALLHGASLYSQVKAAAVWGISAEAALDARQMYARKDEIVGTLRGGIEQLLKQNKVTVVMAQARIEGPGRVSAGEETYEGKNILIATGSRPVMPLIPGLELPGVITSDDIIRQPFEGEHLAILGGGVIGSEIASVYLSMGIEVTIIEALERVLPQMDREISQTLSMQMKRGGAQILTGKRLTEVTLGEHGLMLHLEGLEQPISCDNLLVSVGRRAHTEGLFAPDAQLPHMERGRILTDNEGMTSIPGVYAIGDVSSAVQLAHLASAQGLALADRLAGRPVTADLDLVPACVYTEPEIATVGIDEQTAKAQGIELKTGKYLMAGNGRTMIAGGGRSFIKLLFAAEDERLLGAQLMCERASDLIDGFTMAIANRMTVTDMLRGMRPHPSFVEGVQEALESVHGRAIHVAPARK